MHQASFERRAWHGTARHGSTWKSTVTARSNCRRARVRQNMDVLPNFRMPNIPNGTNLEWMRTLIFVYKIARGALCAYARMNTRRLVSFSFVVRGKVG